MSSSRQDIPTRVAPQNESSHMGPLQKRFLERLNVRLDALREAQSRGDLRTIARCGHQVRGAAGMYGFPRLGDAAAKIETLAMRGAAPEEIESALLAFGSLCAEAIRTRSIVRV